VKNASLAVVAALLAAATAQAHSPKGAVGGGSTVRAVDPAAMVLARQRFFGAANVDPATGAVRRDRVILSWFGVSNFAAAIRGHVVLLDAWVARGAHSGYVPTSPAELARLMPELVVVGHAHFDHAADAVPIAEASGAKLVGLREHCSDFAQRATAAVPSPCVAVLEPGEARKSVDLLRGVEVRVLRHLHSGARTPSDDVGGYHVPVLPQPSLTPVQHPPTPQDVADTVGHAPDGEGGSVMYRFAFGDFSLVWHDTSGPLTDLNPGTFPLLRDLRPVDVEVGAIQGFNQLTNGMRDPRQYVEALRPKRFVPSHHDDWLPGITGPGSGFRAPLEAELARMPAEQRPAVTFLEDPRDYVKPVVFEVAIEPERLVRRCVGRGVLRVALDGDIADVDSVVVRRGTRVLASRLPVRLARSVVRRGGRLRATLVRRDGSVAYLARTLPRCGLR
jgi:L-ascorbate metabolism protein UlaG (beta-lactamase superfamily)